MAWPAREWGMSDGDFSFYGAAEGVTDAGWRFHSQSNLARLYADAGWRFGDSEIHLVASGAATSLGVVGPTPVRPDPAQSASRSIPFPRPRGTRIGSLALNGKTRLDDHWQLEGSRLCAHACSSAMSTAMTAISNAARNSSSFGGKLCLQDDAFPARPSPAARPLTFRNQFAILDQNGASHRRSPPALSTARWTAPSPTAPARAPPCRSPAMRRCSGLANYFTAGGSFDAQRHRLSLHQHPGPHLPRLGCGGGSDAGRLGQHHPHQRQSGLCARSIWAPPPTITASMPWMRWT